MVSVEHTLLDLIQAKTGVRPQRADTFESLPIDSLAMAELTVEIENAFGIRVGEDVMDVTSIAELIAYIERQMAACDKTS